MPAPPEIGSLPELLGRVLGKSPQAARAWVESSDEVNAELVGATRDAADVVVDVDRI